MKDLLLQWNVRPSTCFVLRLCCLSALSHVPCPTHSLESTHASDWPVASLGWVTPGAATEGVTPLFFFLKTWRPFFAHRCHYHYRFLLLSLGCHPLEGGVSPFLPVRPRFSTILCKFARKKVFSFGCHPPGGCHPGRSAPPLVTPLWLATAATARSEDTFTCAVNRVTLAKVKNTLYST